MAIGIDDLDDIDGFESMNNPDTGNISINTEEPDTEEPDTSLDNDDFITTLLKSKGIEDTSKINFEDNDGTIEEKNWNDLSNEDKLGILQSLTSESDLDDSEKLLIDTIRNSKVTPSEYLQAIQQDAINHYIQNVLDTNYQYEVDLLNDDELFVYDLMARTKDLTKDEAVEALEKVKQDENLYKKLIEAIRKEYKALELESIRLAQLEQEELAQELYEQFSNLVIDQINDFTEFSGYELNMDDSDKDELYEFITGADITGLNYFAKALSDPKILVQTAWFALNGELMLDSITKYFEKEISLVRDESYKKGLKDAGDKTNNSQVVYKSKSLNSPDLDDLDNF